MNILIKGLFVLWQAPQFIIGEFVCLFNTIFLRKRFLKNGFISCDDYKYATSNVSMYKSKEIGVVKGLSLGRRIFLYYDSDYHDKAKLKLVINESLRHEYGHSVQSTVFGVVYLIFGIFSLLVTGVSPNRADRMWFEKNANKIVNDKNIKIEYK